MKSLVIGSGGREHALCWRLSKDGEVFCAPGNAGIQAEYQTFDVAVNDQDGLSKLAKTVKPDVIVIGPEDPLIMGLADLLRRDGHQVFGPSQRAAQLEGSKAWMKELMQKASIPCAQSQTFRELRPAQEFVRRLFDQKGGAVIKASGPAQGKGVVVCPTMEQAFEALEDYLIHKTLGTSGQTVVIEEMLAGREISLMTLVSGRQIRSLPFAQDHKRIFDLDRGPNTGGMGSFSPVENISDFLLSEVEDLIVRPLLNVMQEEGASFSGNLFSGLMLCPDGPKCLEYNVRFGDPETQSLMPRMGVGFGEALLASAEGRFMPEIEVLDTHVVSVVMSSRGYPGDYEKGIPIEIGQIPEDVQIFHSGTTQVDGQLRTSGGRVLCVSAMGSSMKSARELAYRAIKEIRFEGNHYRSDISCG